jgi:hypothetical protein
LFKKGGEFLKSITKKNTTKYLYVLDKYLDQFTDIFVEEEYLDTDNAKRMKELLSGSPDSNLNPIYWRKKYFSLITFFYFADKMDYFNKEICPTRYNRKYDIDETRCSALLLHHFITFDKKKLPHYTNFNYWQQLNNAINELYNKVNKDKNFICTDKDNQFTKTILYCFNHGISIVPEYNKYGEERGIIDKDMTDIVYRVWENNKKSSASWCKSSNQSPLS